MKIDTRGLAVVLEELNVLDQKDLEGTINKQEQRRRASLMSQAAAIRDGVKLKNIIRREHNEQSREAGLPEFEPEPKPSRRERRKAAWKAVVENAGPKGLPQTTEFRDMNEGGLISQIGTYTGLGFFVPTGFMPKFWRAMAAHDALFDDDCVTVHRTKDGRPFPVPVFDDIANVAVAVKDGVQDSEADISDVDHVSIGAWTYKGPLLRCSIESFQDCDEITVPQLFKAFQLDRIARGVGTDLMTGGGSTKPLGLIPTLMLAAAPTVVAAGSAGNDGSTNTGLNSVGSVDLMNAMNKLDSAYWASDKVRWFMNRSTLTNLLNLSDKMGRPLLGTAIKYKGSTCYIYGIKVAICPSMNSIGAANTPILLGDGAYWMTRLVSADDESGFQIFKEKYADFGQVGMRLFARADGALLWRSSESNAKCPFVMIQNHS